MIVITLIIVQLFAICVSTYLLLLERKYCGHCYWWSDAFACFLFIVNFIPFVGLLTSIALCVDCTRNIINELDEDKK